MDYIEGVSARKDKNGKLTHIAVDMRIQKNTMRPILQEMLNKQREAFIEILKMELQVKKPDK